MTDLVLDSVTLGQSSKFTQLEVPRGPKAVLKLFPFRETCGNRVLAKRFPCANTIGEEMKRNPQDPTGISRADFYQMALTHYCLALKGFFGRVRWRYIPIEHSLLCHRTTLLGRENVQE